MDTWFGQEVPSCPGGVGGKPSLLGFLVQVGSPDWTMRRGEAIVDENVADNVTASEESEH